MSFDQAPPDRYAEERDDGGIPEFLLDPIGVARRRWLPASLSFGAGLLVTLAAILFVKPMYVGQATIMITSQQIREDLVRPTFEEDTLANVSAMIGEVLSVENLSKLIGQLHLYQDRPDARRVDLVNRLRAKITTTPQIAQSNRNRGSTSAVYAISYESKSPQESAEVANAIAGLFVEASIERRNSQARRATEFLRNELERVEKQLREQSTKVSEFRGAHRGQLPDEQANTMRKIDMLATRQASLTQQIAAKEDRILTASSHGGAEGEVLIAELRRELARQTAIHTEEHPNVIALRERIKRLEASERQASSLPAATRAIIDTERRDIARMREQVEQIGAELAELNARMDRGPQVAEQLAALEQKEAVLREDYAQAMRKVQEAELAESLESAQQGGQVSVLDPAVPPTSPKLGRWLILLLGLTASLMLSLAVAVLLELIDPVVIGVRQLEKWSDSPVLGTVPLVTER